MKIEKVDQDEEMRQELDDCDVCYGQGYVHSNDEEGNDEIQRCDECEKFESDQDAKGYYIDLGFPDVDFLIKFKKENK
jgi:hypothetical protein